MPPNPLLSAAALDLPVRSVLPELLGALRRTGVAVLVAPPGAGKTTVVPLALAGLLTPAQAGLMPGEQGESGSMAGGRIVVAEPRRVATRAAARRMAALLGEEVGKTVGYTVRGDRRTGPATRIEVVTTGVLVQRLQRGPELPGTDVILLDECHERHLDADLALAFAVDVRTNLRPDLRLLATSATADADRLASVLAGGTDSAAPTVTAEVRAYPVDVVWCPPGRPPVPASDGRVDPALLDHVASVTRRAAGERAGDVLVFLPGVREIGAVANRLSAAAADSGPDGFDLVTLHGRQSGAAQDAALRPAARRRVVLATAIAETSLTVPGVRAVVDAGLSREPRIDLSRDLGSLVTVRVSKAAAHQRAGRAGREAPGTVYRCWSAADHERLPDRAQPEIAIADLTGFALDLASWGYPDGTGLALPDPPPAAAMTAAGGVLRALGAVDGRGGVTARGRLIARTGIHPRLGRALLDGADLVGDRRATEVVALLAEEAVTGPGQDDLVAVWRALRDGVDRAAAARWRDEVRRLSSVAGRGGGAGRTHDGAGRTDDRAGRTDDGAAAVVVGLAFPERLARARQPGGSAYLMAGGTAAELNRTSRLAGTEWLAVAVADRAPGGSLARIRLAAPLDEATARRIGAHLYTVDDEVAWSDGDVVARRVERLGAIVLVDRPLNRADPVRVGAALLDGLRREGLGLLRWSADAAGLRHRLAFCHRVLGEPWPDVSDPALLDLADRWLGPDLAGARRRADLGRIDAGTALRRLLPWPEAARLDELAPERITVPSGSRVRLDYTDPAGPVLAVKVQEAFGWQDAPTVAGGRVPVLLHLLSPAGRPTAVTRDLASFWRTGYPMVRADLRGRYPRHPWPEDPTSAVPTRRTNPRRPAQS